MAKHDEGRETRAEVKEAKAEAKAAHLLLVAEKKAFIAAALRDAAIYRRDLGAHNRLPLPVAEESAIACEEMAKVLESDDG